MSKKTLKSVKKSENEAIVQVKNNQKRLFQACEKISTKTKKSKDSYSDKTKARNRKEIRKVQTFTNLRYLPKDIKDEWGKYLKMIIKVSRSRQELNTKTKKWTKSFEISYYLSTIKLTAQESAKAIRGHWGIENRNHCVRDISFNEDASRIRDVKSLDEEIAAAGVTKSKI